MPIPVWVLLGFAAWTLQPTSAPAGAIILHAGDNVSAIVNAAPVGATFFFEPGIYRGVCHHAEKRSDLYRRRRRDPQRLGRADQLDSKRQSLGHWRADSTRWRSPECRISSRISIGRAIPRLCSLTIPH